ncbi:hypothetical protein [Halohasta litorea]|uniref:Uncharacterized protein n=1 Tax=Halohasta litorea TaxID=869891 RepID=A0ABD6D6P9_9EURY|nr:hypothetical protein [Halohasta litorea]
MEAVDRFLAMLDLPKNGQSKVFIPIIADPHVQIAVLGQPTIKCVNVVQQYGSNIYNQEPQICLLYPLSRVMLQLD